MPSDPTESNHITAPAGPLPDAPPPAQVVLDAWPSPVVVIPLAPPDVEWVEPELQPEVAVDAGADPTDVSNLAGAGPIIERFHLEIAGAIALLTAIFALLGNPKPTGGPVIDIFMTLGFVITVVMAASRATRAAVLATSLIAFVFIGISWWMVAAATALFVALWYPQRMAAGPRTSVAQSAVVALALLVLLRLPGLGFTGSPSLLAAAGVLPVLVAGYRAAPRVVRARLRAAAIVVVAVTVVGSLLSTAAALAGQVAAEAGVQRANDGLEAARDGDQDRAVRQLEQAATHFGEAESAFGSWWAESSRLVPVVAQNARALEVAAAQGQALATAAVSAATTADIEQVRGIGGSIDLDLVSRVGAELQRTAASVDGAIVALREVRTPWLVPMVNSRLQSADEDLIDASKDVNLARDATAVLPGILGADGPRTYLVMFTNPAESRELGGFAGAYAFLDAVDGKVSLIQSGRGGDLNPPNHPVIPKPGLDDAGSYPPLYINFGEDGLANYFGNLTGTLDFPTVAKAARDLMPKKGLPEIDGVMIMDPFALAAILELIGQPISVGSLDEPLTHENVADFLLRDQYVDGSTTNEREDLLGEIADQAFSALLAINTPGPRRLGDLLGPVARQKRMMFTTFVAEENAFLQQVYLRPFVPDLPDHVDYLAVVGDTAAPNKLGAYLLREIAYTVEVDPATGRFDGEVEITLTNTAPPDLPAYVRGEPDYYFDLEPGVQRERVSVYSSNDVFGDVLHNGVVSDSNEFFIEYGMNRRLTFIDIEEGAQQVVTFSIRGTTRPGEYWLYLAEQPRTTVDAVTLNIAATPGWHVKSTGTRSYQSSITLDEDSIVGLEFDRD